MVCTCQGESTLHSVLLGAMGSTGEHYVLCLPFLRTQFVEAPKKDGPWSTVEMLQTFLNPDAHE